MLPDTLPPADAQVPVPETPAVPPGRRKLPTLGELLVTDGVITQRQLETALERQAMERLGLEAKSSNLITGSEKIEVAARRGQVHMLLHAGDAAPDGCRKLDQAWRVGQEAEGQDLAGLVLPVGRDALSQALGRENVVHIAVTDRAAAARLGALLSRWQSYAGCANAAGEQAPPGAGAAARTEAVSIGHEE